MKKVIVILFSLFFNLWVVNASEFLISCLGNNAGQTDVCNYFLIPRNSTVCPAVIGTDCVPGVEETPLTSPFVKTINLPEGFVLKNCKVATGNASCNITNNVVTITPNNFPFSDNIDGTMEVQIPKNAQDGSVWAEGFQGHVNYTDNNLYELYVNNEKIPLNNSDTTYTYTTTKDKAVLKLDHHHTARVSRNKNPIYLNYGENKIYINVTSQSGVTKKYTLVVNRKDIRSDDSTLKNITLSDGAINFDSSKKDYSVTVTNSDVTVNAIKNNDNASVQYLNHNTVSLDYGESKTINIKVTSEKGTSSIYSITLIRKDTRSDDSTLKNITLSDGNIDFNNSKRDYVVTVSSYSVTVNAIINNSNAILEYLTGNTVYLGYGESQIVKVKVTSEKGTSSIYSVTLTRKDTRSNDATLKSLTVTNTDIKFSGNTTYNTQVGNNVSKIEIKANANDNKATISGIGTKNLNVGNNSFIITVEAENGDTKNYIIVINRKAKQSENNKNEANKLSSDNKLKSLTIDEISFEFDKDILDYNLFVDYNVDKINIDYVTSSDKATVTMTDISYLEIGLNIVDLIVVAEDGSVKTYTLNITRRPERLVTENNSESILELINSDSYEDIYVVDESSLAPYTITSDVLTALKETGKTIIYEITYDLGLVYQIKFVGGELTDTNELRFAVWFKSPNSLAINSIVGSQEYLSFVFDVEGDVPNGVHLSIYKFTQVSDKENLDLYEYDESNNKLNLILDDVIIKDNVIELDINDLTKEYVIAEIIPIETGKKIGESITINLPLIVVLIHFLGALISLVVIAIKKKMKLKKQSKSYGVDGTNSLDLDNKKF